MVSPSTRCAAGVALAVAMVTAGRAAAQDANLNAFLWEKSYAAMGTPSVIGKPSYYDSAVAEPDLLAEAQIAIHLGLRRGLTVQEIREGSGSGFNFFLTPQFRLRGLDVASGPVRSISFMPKFVGQMLWARGGDGLGTPGRRHLYGVSLILGHHSNGGAACEFVDETLELDGRCVPTPDPPPPASQREIRVNNGNFSTNYIEVGGGYRIGRTDDANADHWVWFAELAVSYQRHHDWFGFPLPGGPKGGFADLYGLHRLRVDHAGFVHVAAPVALRWGARLDAFSPEEERFPGSRNYTFESEAFVQFVDGLGATLPSFVPDFVGLGVRYSRGMDYYNTQFVRDIGFWQFVITIDPWTPALSDPL